jgi:uncharacterized protein
MSYEGRLRSAPGCAERTVDGEAGLRLLEVEHEGNRQSSPEEAEAIAAAVDDLLARGLALEDILVVAAYNAQVRCLRSRLPAGARVGTVDKFQGQEAPVVFFSMASSSGEDVPRGMEFLFSRNRLNVAISRAQSLAVVVCAPRLLIADCRTVEQVQLVNALCRFAEEAQPLTVRPQEAGGAGRP